MNDTGTYEERGFPTFRNPTIDTLDQGLKKHHVPFLFEADVTEGRKYLREFKARTDEAISFTGWVMKCIGQAVSDHKSIHALRKGGRRLILFDDVDISIVVERSVGHNDGRPETLPMPYVVGDAIEIREYLSTTVLFDHDVIDGAPVAHFVQRLKQLIETGHGLDEYETINLTSSTNGQE